MAKRIAGLVLNGRLLGSGDNNMENSNKINTIDDMD